mmetsp:Transcript_75126/g.220166  ORF Transcript_75126/g.220166 Transcript_75126/m.220166 type:complete len:279 (+) Transcript_75126:285-1121(+)
MERLRGPGPFLALSGRGACGSRRSFGRRGQGRPPRGEPQDQRRAGGAGGAVAGGGGLQLSRRCCCLCPSAAAAAGAVGPRLACSVGGGRASSLHQFLLGRCRFGNDCARWRLGWVGLLQTRRRNGRHRGARRGAGLAPRAAWPTWAARAARGHGGNRAQGGPHRGLCGSRRQGGLRGREGPAAAAAAEGRAGPERAAARVTGGAALGGGVLRRGSPAAALAEARASRNRASAGTARAGRGRSGRAVVECLDGRDVTATVAAKGQVGLEAAPANTAEIL